MLLADNSGGARGGAESSGECAVKLKFDYAPNAFGLSGRRARVYRRVTRSTAERMSRIALIADFLALRRNTTLLLVALVLAGTGERLWLAFAPKYLETGSGRTPRFSMVTQSL